MNSMTSGVLSFDLAAAEEKSALAEEKDKVENLPALPKIEKSSLEDSSRSLDEPPPVKDIP